MVSAPSRPSSFLCGTDQRSSRRSGPEVSVEHSFDEQLSESFPVQQSPPPVPQSVVPESIEIRKDQSIRVPGVGLIQFRGNISSRTCFTVSGVQMTHFNNRFPIIKTRFWCHIQSIGNSAVHMKLVFIPMTDDPAEVEARWEEGIQAAARCGQPQPWMAYSPPRTRSKPLNRKRGQ